MARRHSPSLLADVDSAAAIDEQLRANNARRDAIRARVNSISKDVGVRAERRIGYSRSRTRELQRLFVREHAAEVAGPAHVMDVLFGFAQTLGIHARSLRWDIPIDEESCEYAREVVDPGRPTLVISPCASRPSRSWTPEGYALVADHAAQRHGMQVILCGGKTERERRMGDAIRHHAASPVVDLIGRDTLKQLLAVLERADLLLSPDSGPVHMATAVGTPVLGLFAGTDSRRSGPYFSRELCVDAFDAAARRYAGRPADELRWGKKIDHPDVMKLIDVDAVRERLDAFMATPAAPRRRLGACG